MSGTTATTSIGKLKTNSRRRSKAVQIDLRSGEQIGVADREARFPEPQLLGSAKLTAKLD